MESLLKFHSFRIIGKTSSGRRCLYRQRYYENAVEWEHDCNLCTCKNGIVECTKLWCGPSNCFVHLNVTVPAISCEANEVCLLQSDTICFTAPCLPVGECWHVSAINEKNPPAIMTKCLPNITILNINCAKITIFFNKSLMPIGVSVDVICHILRRIPAMHILAINTTLVILCDLELVHPNAIVVSISAVSSHIGDATIALVYNAAETLANTVSQKLTNSSLLSAVVEVKLETIITDSAGEMHFPVYVIPIFCSAVAILGTIFIMILIFWHHHIIKRWKIKSHLSLSLLQIKDVKSNNGETGSNNDNAVTRFHNPIFYTNRCRVKSRLQVDSIDNKILPSELNEPELGIEKYEKSPQRLLKSYIDLKNVTQYHISQQRSSKIKDINVELSRTRFLVNAEAIIV